MSVCQDVRVVSVVLGVVGKSVGTAPKVLYLAVLDHLREHLPNRAVGPWFRGARE